MNKFIKTRAARILSRANELGLTDKNGKPLDLRQVAELVAADEGFRNVHAYDECLKDGVPVLRSDAQNRGGDNYTFVGDMDEQRGVYIRFGEYSVRVYMPFGDEGIAADIYMADMEDHAMVSGCYAFHSDGEDALCDNLAVDLDDVAEWVGLHYQRNFDAEAPMARLTWIRRYAEAHADTADSQVELPLTAQCAKVKSALLEDGAEVADDPADDDAFVCSVCGTRHDIEDSIETPVGLICPQCEGSMDYTLAVVNQAGPFETMDQIRDIADSIFENFDYGTSNRKVEAHNGWDWSGFGHNQHLSKTVFLKWTDEPEEADSHSESFSVTVKDGRVVDFG